nr:hypothetical protein [Polynucleobacter sp. GWA2_45_21]
MHIRAVITLTGKSVQSKKDAALNATARAANDLLRNCFNPTIAFAVKLGITRPPIMISIITIKNNDEIKGALLSMLICP